MILMSALMKNKTMGEDFQFVLDYISSCTNKRVYSPINQALYYYIRVKQIIINE